MSQAWALPEVDEAACDGCGECVAICHAEAVTLLGGKASLAHPEACDYCTDCEAVCPVGAMRCPFEIVSA